MLHTCFPPSVHGTGSSSVMVTQTRRAHSLRCQQIQIPSPLACTPLARRPPGESALHTDPTHTFIHPPALEPYMPVAHLPMPSMMMRHSAALEGEGATLHSSGRCHSYGLVWPLAQVMVPQVLLCSPRGREDPVDPGLRVAHPSPTCDLPSTVRTWGRPMPTSGLWKFHGSAL